VDEDLEEYGDEGMNSTRSSDLRRDLAEKSEEEKQTLRDLLNGKGRRRRMGDEKAHAVHGVDRNRAMTAEAGLHSPTWGDVHTRHNRAASLEMAEVRTVTYTACRFNA